MDNKERHIFDTHSRFNPIFRDSGESSVRAARCCSTLYLPGFYLRCTVPRDVNSDILSLGRSFGIYRWGFFRITRPFLSENPIRVGSVPELDIEQAIPVRSPLSISKRKGENNTSPK